MKYNISQIINQLKALDQPWVMLMIGPPGVGKSTFVKSLQEAGIKFHIASTDDLIESYGAKHKLLYAEAFKRANLKDIKRQMINLMHESFMRGENVINDQTNMGSKKRRTTLLEAPENYLRIGLMFNASNEELKARLAKREAETGKKIGWGIVENMFKSYSTPTKGEGFTHLWELQ